MAASASRARRRSKRRYQAAADIPIVKLNPQNILSAKLRDEAATLEDEARRHAAELVAGGVDLLDPRAELGRPAPRPEN